MKRMLMLASVASMIDQFNMPNIRMLLSMGYQVDVACNFADGNTCSADKIAKLIEELDQLGVGHYQIDFSRSILNMKSNVKAYKQVKKLMTENQYEFVHCHSPIGGAVARLAGKVTKTEIIYTAHGFHFYKGAPLKNWLIYYPVEWILAHWTDVLLTINSEDFAFAQRKMKAKKVEYVPGIGIDMSRFGRTVINKSDKRAQLGIPEDAVLLFSVGELNENKNHETVIKAISDMDVYYLIAGQGMKKDELQNLIHSQNMTDRIRLLGFRNDVSELYAIADLFVFPSFREGLSVALMEAMASGLPCVVSEIRGNVDLIDENGGVRFNPNSVEECRTSIKKVIDGNPLEMGEYNIRKIQGFSIEPVMEKLKEIYTA